MERSRQLSHVAFGGDWAEGILPRERKQQALSILKAAAQNAVEEEAVTFETMGAFDALAGAPRIEMLKEAWKKAARIENARLRLSELSLVYERVVAVVGVAAR